ncbi:MAG: O-antigen ligase family protein [Burkholderiales bacterium]|nr:O-antigen ligase family protein [Anaerolineae bacterium]
MTLPFRTSWSILVVPIVVLISALIGYAIGHSYLDPEFLITLFAGVVAIFLLLNTRTHWALLCIGLGTFAFGHRSISLVGVRVTPLVAILLMLWFVALFNYISGSQRRQLALPRSLALFTFLISARGLIGVIDGNVETRIMGWVVIHGLGLAAFPVVQALVNSTRRIEVLLRISLIASIYISVIGIIEFYSYSSLASFHWLFPEYEPLASAGNFFRASFRFWGSPAAVIFVMWGVVIALHYLFNDWKSSRRDKLLAAASLPLFTLAIYVAGSRIIWISYALTIILTPILMRRRAISVGLIVLSLAVALPVLSVEFWDRLNTVTSFLFEGEILDNSTRARVNLVDNALEVMRTRPLQGTGFYGRREMHNVFFEISVTTGVVPMIVYAIFYFQLVARIFRVWLTPKNDNERKYGQLFLMLGLLWTIQMFTGTLFNNSIYGAPHWVMMAIGWYLPDILAAERKPEPIEATEPELPLLTAEAQE